MKFEAGATAFVHRQVVRLVLTFWLWGWYVLVSCQRVCSCQGLKMVKACILLYVSFCLTRVHKDQRQGDKRQGDQGREQSTQRESSK